MPNLYVRSGGDAGAWTGTYASLALASAADAAGDVVYVASDHAESLATSQVLAFDGTAASPVKLIAATTAAAPPTAVSTAASMTTTGTSSITFSGFLYAYGITFNCATGSVNASISCADVGAAVQEYENCNFYVHATGSTARINIGSGGNFQPAKVTWTNCNAELNNTGVGVTILGGDFFWNGGAVVAGVVPASGFLRATSAGEHVNCVVTGVDFTEIGVTGFVVGKAAGARCKFTFINCKFPAWTTGGIVTGTMQAGDRIEVYNCDSSDTNYVLYTLDMFGSVQSETGIYNDAGVDTTGIENANSDIAGFSWKMVASDGAGFPHQTLVSPEIVKWNTVKTGTLTATVEIVHDSQGSGTGGALLDTEIWMEVMCLDPGGTPLGKWQADRCANLNLNSNAADQASSSATWTGDSAGWDTQKLVVSFTPKEKGYVHARVCLAKASATVYVDPLYCGMVSTR
jgi:hypothetical protein